MPSSSNARISPSRTVERRFRSLTAAVMVGKLLLHRMYVCVRVVRRLARRPMLWRGPLAYTRERSSRDEWREAYQLQYDSGLPAEVSCRTITTSFPSSNTFNMAPAFPPKEAV